MKATPVKATQAVAARKAAAKKTAATRVPAAKAAASKAPAKAARAGKAPAKAAATKAPGNAAAVSKAPGKAAAVSAAPAKAAAVSKAPAKAAAASKAPAKATAASKAPGKAAAASKSPAKAGAASKSPAKAAAAKKAPTKGARTARPTPPAAPAVGQKSSINKVAPAAAAPATNASPSKTSTASKTSPRRTSVPAKPAVGLLPVLPGDRPWTAHEVSGVRAALQVEATDLRLEIAEASASYDKALREGDQGTGDDQADAGSATFEREHELSLAANSRDLLAQVERALQRLDAGTYGSCEVCGKPIGKERLKAFPKVTLCLTCKQRENRR
ncbi:MAG TPA: TraR/DksA family transcriptional regulator [Mycobacteriales bacterium]|nr:TraR/DksA family transcriptional regulator [Mycobacteriales bacterium]